MTKNVRSQKHHSTGKYTHFQKKRSMESCIYFWEECRWMNFVVYFIFANALGNNVQKTCPKIVHGCLAILRSLSTGKTTKIHSLRK